jgi:hypothetical protein
VINGNPITVPAGNSPMVIDLGALGKIFINPQEIAGNPDHVLAQALVVVTPLINVVVAESYVQKAKNTFPCTGT